MKLQNWGQFDATEQMGPIADAYVRRCNDRRGILPASQRFLRLAAARNRFSDSSPKHSEDRRDQDNDLSAEAKTSFAFERQPFRQGRSLRKPDALGHCED